MEITCTACGKEIAPLELYDGTWSCPHCRNLLIDQQSELKVTRENEELFRQGELLYAQWLFNRDGRANFSLVEKAIGLCRRSARLGNPKAIARLGYYYDKDYIGGNFTEAMRVKLAYTYYSQICYSGLNEVETPPSIKMNWNDVCRQTAHAMLLMLSQAPAEVQESKTYNVKANLERLRSNFGEDFNFSGYASSYYKLSNKERFFSTLIACWDKKRAPLFGAFRLTVGDFKEIYERSWPGDDKIESALGHIAKAKDVIISYMKVSELSNQKGKFNRLGTSSSFERMFDELDESEMIWIFCFNNHGGHKYLSSNGKRKKVLSVLYKDGEPQDMLKKLLQFGKTSFYAFYDDDIYHRSQQKSLQDATRVLIDDVCSGGGSE